MKKGDGIMNKCEFVERLVISYELMGIEVFFRDIDYRITTFSEYMKSLNVCDFAVLVDVSGKYLNKVTFELANMKNNVVVHGVINRDQYYQLKGMRSSAVVVYTQFGQNQEAYDILISI